MAATTTQKKFTVPCRSSPSGGKYLWVIEKKLVDERGEEITQYLSRRNPSPERETAEDFKKREGKKKEKKEKDDCCFHFVLVCMTISVSMLHVVIWLQNH